MITKKIAKRQKLESELAEANRRIMELQAQLASTLGSAFDALPKTGDNNKGSFVILQIFAPGGNLLVGPVVIRDGLSKKSVTALQEDVARSFELATLVNPAMARTRYPGKAASEG